MCNSTLKELRNSISGKGIHEIALSCSLQHAKLSGENDEYSKSSDQREVQSKANTTLQVMNLSHNPVDIYGVKSLSLMLQKNSSLITL